MLASAFPRRMLVLVGALAAVICAAAGVPSASGSAEDAPSDAAQPSQSKKQRALDMLAARLLQKDPGARVGGSTQVSTTPGATVVGVPGRTNFIMALNARQQLLGGRLHDQLGALSPQPSAAARVAGAAGVAGPRLVRIHGRGGHDLIHGGGGHDQLAGGRGHDHIRGNAGHDKLVGGHGHDVIHGGPGHDRLHGGHGHDRFVDRQGNTTVFPGPGRNHIDVSDGGNDRVLCHPNSTNRIVADGGDRLHRHCRNARSSVVYRRPASNAPDARAAQQAVTGDGTNESPFTADCADPQNTDCTVTAFPYRTLEGLWANEYVPAYQCSSSHPYLLQQGFAPGGTSLPPGVAANGLGDIGMSITGVKWSEGILIFFERYALGTETGFPKSSVTNWTFGTRSYQVQLHCTSDEDNGYTKG
jgi:hypothetical protein